MRKGGFTIAQLVLCVIVIMFALIVLIPALKNQIAKARSIKCADNIRKIHRGLYLYREDNNHWWPEKLIPTQAGLIRERNDWITLVAESKYVAELDSFICPGDINAPSRDAATQAFFRREVSLAPSYGLNQLTGRDYGVAASDDPGINRKPTRPERTILLADRGPDFLKSELPEDEAARRQLLELARDAGRLPADDDFRIGVIRPTGSWLTARHNLAINLMTIGGSAVKAHNIEQMLRQLPERYYDDCATGNCTYCNVFKAPHYDFSSSSLYWWTGPYDDANRHTTSQEAE